MVLSNQWLRVLFSLEGSVVDVFISRKVRKHSKAACGFVRFQRREEVMAAMRNLDGFLVKGNRILVSLAKYNRDGMSLSKLINPSKLNLHRRRLIKNSSFRDSRRYSEVLKGEIKNPMSEQVGNVIPVLFSLEIPENQVVVKMLKHAVVAEIVEATDHSLLLSKVNAWKFPVAGMKSLTLTKLLLHFSSEEEAIKAIVDGCDLWNTENMVSLTHARLLVRTKAQNKIESRIQILSEHGGYDVWVKESIYCSRLPTGFPVYKKFCSMSCEGELNSQSLLKDWVSDSERIIDGEVKLISNSKGTNVEMNNHPEEVQTNVHVDCNELVLRKECAYPCTVVWGCDAVVNITDGGYLGLISKGGEDVHVDLSANLQAQDLAACNEPTHLLDWFDPISEVELKAHENCHANLSTAAAYVVDTCLRRPTILMLNPSWMLVARRRVVWKLSKLRIL